MADQNVVFVIDGYQVALLVALAEGLEEHQARVMFSMTRMERRQLERELAREIEQAIARSRRRARVWVHTSKYSRNEKGDLEERVEIVPEWINKDLVHEEAEIRLRELLQDWVAANPWIRRIRPRDNVGWIRF